MPEPKYATVKLDTESPAQQDVRQGQEEEASPSSPAGVTRHRMIIMTSWLFATLPVTALTIAFLVMVFHWRVTHNAYIGLPKNLQIPSTEDDGNGIYVDLNASTILFVASWASSLAPMLTGFLMALASFPIARQLSSNIRKSLAFSSNLPTPYQLALTLKFLDGSALAAIWSWIMYLATWRKSRQPQPPLLVATSSVAVMATILGLLVSAADTWLHLTTTTVPFTQIIPVANPVEYSFGVIPQCLKRNNSVAAQSLFTYTNEICSVSNAGQSTFLRKPSITLQMLSNLSSVATVYTHTTKSDEIPYNYLGIPYDVLDADHDFTAHSYASHTSCHMMTKRCDVKTDASSVPFNCSVSFNGLINSLDLQSAFFTDESMQNLSTLRGSNYGTDNPYYIALASAELAGETTPGGTTRYPNDDFVRSLHGAETFVIGCKNTIYDVEYDQVNRSITRFDTQISNTSISNIWQSTIALYNTGYIQSLKQAMTAAFVTTNSSQDFANEVELAFGRANMALGAQGIETRPTLALQKRRTTLVARVPVAPLVALVAFSLLFVVTGLLLTALAMWSARSREVRNIQATLGISGLVADRFEEEGLKREAKSIDGFFAENSGRTSQRVAIETDKETTIYGYTTWKRKATSDSGNELLR